MRKKLAASILGEVSGAALPLIAFGAALNLIAGQLVTLFKLPIFLDTLGTVLVAITAGPWAGILSGVIAAVVGGIYINPYLPYYIPTVAAVAAFAGLMAKWGFFRTVPRAILAGIVQGLIAATISAPITARLFGGVTLAGSSLIVAYLRATGKTLLKSVFLAGVAAEPVDKALTFLLALLLVRRLPVSITRYYPKAAFIVPAQKAARTGER